MQLLVNVYSYIGIAINRIYGWYSRQQFPAGERADRGLPHRVLQRDLLQDERLQPRRGHAEVLQVSAAARVRCTPRADPAAPAGRGTAPWVRP